MNPLNKIPRAATVCIYIYIYILALAMNSVSPQPQVVWVSLLSLMHEVFVGI